MDKIGTYIRPAVVGGFSLVELLVVILISSLLASLALPMLDYLVATTRASSYSQQLFEDMHLARTEAIKRNVAVSLCRSENLDQASPSCVRGMGQEGRQKGWATGWMIFVDKNQNGQLDRTEGNTDTLIRIQNALLADARQGSIMPSPNRHAIIYRPTGQIFGGMMRFTIYGTNSKRANATQRFLCIGAGGRIRVSRLACT